MNVEVESLPHCVTNVRVEVPPDRVNDEWNRVAREFRAQARVPGFRPGKVPPAVIERRFEAQIREELTRKLLGETTREVIRERNLKVLQISDVQDLEIGPDRTMRFTATLITAPEFELPEYKGIPVTVPPLEVPEAEVDKTLESLRERFADYAEIADRPAQAGDFVIIDYAGTIDGQPVESVVPSAGKFLSSNTGFWLRLDDDAFLPGFTAHVVGMRTGEQKSFAIDLPADFPAKDLAGRRIDYTVTLQGIRVQTLPPLDDALAAKVMEGQTLVGLREQVAGSIRRRKEAEAEEAKRSQIMDHLLERVECELPEGMVRNQTQRILADIVRDNQERGIDPEVLQEHKQELVTGASRGARARVKGNFVLARIAEKEGIQATREEFQDRIRSLAARSRMEPAKLLKELQKRDALGSVEEEIVLGKTLDFLASNATVQTAAPEA